MYPNLDHFERNAGKIEQYWEVSNDDFGCISNPNDIPSLKDYIRKLPRIPRTDYREQPYALAVSKGKSSQCLDLFTKLSRDLMLYFSDFLSIHDFLSLRIASRQVASLVIRQTFWKRRINLDMPWIWELHSFHSDAPSMSEKPADRIHSGTEIDWKTVYRDLRIDSFGAPKIKSTMVGQPGLWNRRRIWKTCEQFAKLYHSRRKKLQASDALQFQDEEIVKCTFSSQLLTVVAGAVKASTSFRISLLLNWNQHADRMNLLTYWNENGLLAGIEIIDCSPGIHRRLGCTGQTSLMEKRSIDFSSQDWIEGLEIHLTALDLSKMTRREQADGEMLNGVIGLKAYLKSGTIKYACGALPLELSKRILLPYQGSTIVGLQGAVSDDDHAIITQLGLMEAFRRPEQIPTDVSVSLRGIHAWRNEIPDKVFEVQKENIGYWESSLALDVIPREALIFGATDMDRAHVTGIGVDDTLRRFEVYYDDKPFHCIGNAKEHFNLGKNSHRYPRMKYFSVAGKEGERIISVRVQVGHLPTALHVITNHSRQAFFGTHWDRGNLGEHFPPRGKAIGGLYASFGHVSGKKINPTSISTLLVASGEDLNEASDVGLDSSNAIVDADGNFWDPSYPPSIWKLDGPVFGSNETNGVVTLVDLSRPISRVDAIHYCSANNEEVTQNSPEDPATFVRLSSRYQRSKARPFIYWLKGLRIVYADGEIRCLAAAPADEPESLEDMAEKNEGLEIQMSRGVRFTNRWQLEDPGKTMQRVRLWSSGQVLAPEDPWQPRRGCSFGMQFCTGDEWGPRWGDCWKEPIAELDIGGGKGCVVGLKIFVGTGATGEFSTGKDTVNCTGAQAFILKE
ncbi:MAG: hypothetical protein Q9160_005990 [Pyrenula sp. 1 TL-2023]